MEVSNRTFMQKAPHEAVEHKRTQFSFLPKIVNGCLAGIIGVTVVYPLDLVKTRLQSQPVGDRMYTSAFDCLVKVVKKEGFFGMYRGTAAYLMLITPEKAIKLAMNDYFKYLIQGEASNLPVHKQIFAAALAGLSAMWVTTPTDLLKIDLQNSGRQEGSKRPNRRTAAHVIKTVYQKNGVLGFYKGFVPTVSRDVAFCSIYFPLFSFLSCKGPKDINGNTTFWNNFLSGLFAGSFTAWSITPIDVMKTRIQLISNVNSSMVYTGVRDAAKKIYKTEGIRAFYKGGACRIMVVGPLYAVAQTIYYLKVAERMLDV